MKSVKCEQVKCLQHVVVGHGKHAVFVLWKRTQVCEQSLHCQLSLHLEYQFAWSHEVKLMLQNLSCENNHEELYIDPMGQSLLKYWMHWNKIYWLVDKVKYRNAAISLAIKCLNYLDFDL